MVKKRKKKGSSLVMVVIITAMIFTFATSMIAMVTGDYKARLNESKELQNLYQSEAGLDLVYNTIIKNSDTATEYANKQVFDYIAGIKDVNSIADNDEKIYEVLNKKFKENFIKFLGKHETVNNTTNLSDLKATNEGAKNKVVPNSVISITDDRDEYYNNNLLYAIMNLQYLTYESTDANVEIKNENLKWNPISREIKDNQIAEIKVIGYEVDMTNYKITIQVESTFKTDSSKNPKCLENKKTIKTKYIVNAPDYAQNYGISADVKDINLYDASSKAIVADGNLYIKNAGTVNVNGGDIWIKGTDTNESKTSLYSFDKYRSGIFINESSFNVTNGKIYTNATFNLENEADVNIEDLYAVNAYIGAQSVGAASNNNTLVANNVITNNDIAFNSSKSDIQIHNYYGINDKTIESGVIDKADAAMKSSTIIVNNDKNSANSKINIDNAVVMGVAYIETDKAYQTGESVAVRGNYAAYEYILPGYIDKIKLEQYDTNNFKAQFIKHKDGSDLTVKEKADYFKEYYNTQIDGSNFSFSNGGITINNLKSVGASATTNGVNSGNISIDDEVLGDISSFKKEYAKNVYAMGGLDGDDAQMEAYNANVVKNTVASSINSDKLVDYVSDKELEDLRLKEGQLILNKDADKTVHVYSDRIELLDKDFNVLNTIRLASGKDTHKAMIVTKGNVVIGDDNKIVNYNGTIISAGDVTFEGSGVKNITYTQQTIVDISAKFYYYIDGVFKGKPFSVSVGKDTLISKGINNQTSYKQNEGSATENSTLTDVYYKSNAKYDADTYLKKGLWQLVKNKADSQIDS